jgi:polyisoprenyl-phosphate glycosyltransferase
MNFTNLEPWLSVVVPCYNEEEVLDEMYRRLSTVCKSLGAPYEIVLVNDGSTDKTWERIQKLSKSDDSVVGVKLSRNHGHQLALSAGLKICRGARIFIIDADLQDPPELLSKMLTLMEDGCEVVYGQRVTREGETFFKKSSAFIFYRLLNGLVDIDIHRDTGDFRLMSRKALNILNDMPEHHRFIRGMVSWIGMRQEALPYDRAARFAGVTKYPLSRMLRLAVDAITGFSVRPLRIALYLGFFVGACTLLLLIYVLSRYYLGHNVEGWTSLAVIILGLGGVQLVVTGVIGEYLGRLYMESKGRPLYVISDIVRKERISEDCAAL